MNLAFPDADRPSRPRVVLDTNAVFDWMVFDDTGAAPLGAAIAAGRLQWVATAAMRDECFDVLAHGRLAAWRPDLERLRSTWAACCELVGSAPASRLRCRDESDQMFIDLALATRARWLVSKDRAVRRLARPMRGFGVEVLTPSAWAVAVAGGGPADVRADPARRTT